MSKTELHNELLSHLKRSGLKITLSRQVILKAMIDHKGPFSAEDIISKLEKKAIDRVTVYRTLQTMLDLDLINSMYFQAGVTHYELKGEDKHHHHHIVCNSCHVIQPIHLCIPESHMKSVEKLGFTKIKHTLEFSGICAKCS